MYVCACVCMCVYMRTEKYWKIITAEQTDALICFLLSFVEWKICDNEPFTHIPKTQLTLSAGSKTWKTDVSLS